MTVKPAAEKWALAVLVGVVIAAAFIRISGVWFGYPLALHPDEGRLVNPALRMIRTGDLNPHFFNYPSLTIYLQAALFKTASTLGIAARDPSGTGADPNISFYVAGRLLIVAMSLVTLVAVFLVGRRLVGAAAGLAAAVFLGASTLHVLNSFTITVDAPMAMWSSLVLLMAARLITGERKLHDYALAGVFAGLAVGSKYTAVWCVAPILIGHFCGPGPDGGRRNVRKLLAAIGLIPVAFLLTTPYAVLDQGDFRRAVVFEAKHYRSGHFGSEAEGASSLALYSQAALDEGLGPVGSAFAVIGLVGLGLTRTRRAALLASFPLLLLLFVGQYKVFFARNIVAAVPGLAVLAGAGACFVGEVLRRAWTRWGDDRLPAKRVGAVGAGLLVLIGAAGQAAQSSEKVAVLLLPDSRWTALRWIDNNLDAGSSICRERYTPPVQHLGGRFPVTNLGFYSLTRKKVARKLDGCDFVVLSSHNFDRFLDHPDRYPDEAAAYRRFFADHVLVHEIMPDGVTTGGPRILIFEMDRGRRLESATAAGTGTGFSVGEQHPN